MGDHDTLQPSAQRLSEHSVGGTLRGEAEEIVEHGEWGMVECYCGVEISIVNLHAFSNCISWYVNLLLRYGEVLTACFKILRVFFSWAVFMNLTL